MWVPIMPRVPDTISQERKKFGGRSQWKTPTTFASRTHPITPVRFVQMQKVVAEIAENSGAMRALPLIPELKTIQAETDSTDGSE